MQVVTRDRDRLDSSNPMIFEFNLHYEYYFSELFDCTFRIEQN